MPAQTHLSWYDSRNVEAQKPFMASNLSLYFILSLEVLGRVASSPGKMMLDSYNCVSGILLLSLTINVMFSYSTHLEESGSVTTPSHSKAFHHRSLISRVACSPGQRDLIINVLQGVAQWAQQAKATAAGQIQPDRHDQLRNRLFEVAFGTHREQARQTVSRRFRRLQSEAERSPGGRRGTVDERGQGSVLIACDTLEGPICHDEDDLSVLFAPVNRIVLVSAHMRLIFVYVSPRPSGF